LLVHGEGRLGVGQNYDAATPLPEPPRVRAG
jgi:hypothetical protein